MLFLLLLACPADTTKTHESKPSVAEEDNTDGFGGESAVRVLSPANNETVASTFTLRYRVGSNVSSLSLEADGSEVQAVTDVSGSGELVLTLTEGKHDLALIGANAGGTELSRDELTVRVSDSDTWITIASPSDGAEVSNPVTFTVSAADGIDRVELYADEWPIGEMSTASGEGQLTYQFTGTGYARTIEARSVDGAVSDTITITVQPEEEPEVSSFNDLVMKYLESYPTDGSNGYYWPSGSDWSGTTMDVWYQDVLVAEGDPQGRCYCVGLTWEVYMRAWDEVDRTTGGDGTINGMSVNDLYTFRTDWFVRELDGPGPSEAMDNYGVGEEITDPSKLLPGDFLQFWRYSGSGHNVIFVDWILDGGEIVGVEYWSTQSSTDGIGYNTEYFGSSGSKIDPNLVYAARGWMPTDWQAWR